VGSDPLIYPINIHLTNGRIPGGTPGGGVSKYHLYYVISHINQNPTSHY
jgi:hypothetical protein